MTFNQERVYVINEVKSFQGNGLSNNGVIDLTN